jgi:hypothetical protein
MITMGWEASTIAAAYRSASGRAISRNKSQNYRSAVSTYQRFTGICRIGTQCADFIMIFIGLPNCHFLQFYD